ncbi:MAG: sigma-70 family RNA polymerase sigma factor [Gemmatimonadota bacterium]|nr:sigma-70 family RNA polymerase sigma factor [Gemmatimonadota bacterium]
MTKDPAARRVVSRDAFEQETIRFLPDVRRFALALTRDATEADDLVQETYLRAFKARDTFKPDAGTRQWLFTICRNAFLRGKERERWVTASVDADPGEETAGTVALHRAAVEAGIGDVYDRIDFGPALQKALGMLAEPFRVVFALVDIGGLGYAEAARELGVPIGTVRSRLFRARRELQQHLLAFARDAGLARDSAPESA